MWRAILEALAIFLIPFAIYAGWQAIAQRDPRAAMRLTRGPAAWLALAGMILVIASVVAIETLSERHTGGYQRAIWKDGKLIPAEVK